MEHLVHHCRELWAERSRVGLVVLGVVWGTLSLTLLFAFGNETHSATSRTRRNFGLSLLRIGGGARTIAHAGLPAGEWINRVPGDADVVREVPGIEEVAIEYLVGSGNPLEYGDERMNVPVVGCTRVFGELRNQRPRPGGRFLNERDEAEHRRVIFLGGRTAERLFGPRDPVGETVQLWSRSFTVIGVLVPKITSSNYGGEDRDKVTIPASSFRDLYGNRRVSSVWARFAEAELPPPERQTIIDRVFASLAARHGIDPDDRTAIWMMDYVEIEEMIGGIVGSLRIFMLGVGLIGLVVALVGVANVCYLLVEERTREIGVQLALGARPAEIARARLLESLLLTLVGGLVGIAVTAAVLWLLNLIELGPEVRGYLGRPAVSPGLGAVVVVFLMAGGCLAGWYPARRAAAMNPVEALREE